MTKTNQDQDTYEMSGFRRADVHKTRFNPDHRDQPDQDYPAQDPLARRRQPRPCHACPAPKAKAHRLQRSGRQPNAPQQHPELKHSQASGPPAAQTRKPDLSTATRQASATKPTRRASTGGLTASVARPPKETAPSTVRPATRRQWSNSIHRSDRTTARQAVPSC